MLDMFSRGYSIRPSFLKTFARMVLVVIAMWKHEKHFRQHTRFMEIPRSQVKSVQTKLINLSLFYIKSNKKNKLTFIYRSRFLDTWKLFDVRGITDLLVKLIQIFTYSRVIWRNTVLKTCMRLAIANAGHWLGLEKNRIQKL